MAMLPLAVKVGKRLKRWKTKPICCGAAWLRLGIAHGGQVVAVNQHLAARGACEAADHIKAVKTCRSRTAP